MIETTTDLTVWSEWCDQADLHDLYWHAAHFQIWMRAWNCTFFGARMAQGDGWVLKGVLLDSLAPLPNGDGRFHAKTPYDFGGPRLIDTPADALQHFHPLWTEALRTHGVVSEFNRLHPFHPVPPDATLHAHNLVVDLAEGYDAVRAQFYGSWRRDLQKAERKGLTASVTASPNADQIGTFSRLYDITMDRVDAAPWYRFDQTTFEHLLALPSIALATVEHEGQTLAAALLLTSGCRTFYHLSASIPTRGLNPNHALLDGLIRHSITQGAMALHLGAGAPALRTFKSRVANGEVPYHLVRRILDPNAYAALSPAEPTATFPAFLPALQVATR